MCFTWVFLTSKPLEFLETTLDFLAKESDFFNSDSLMNDVNAVVRRVKNKKIAEEKTKKVESNGVSDKKVKEVGDKPTITVKKQEVEKKKAKEVDNKPSVPVRQEQKPDAPEIKQADDEKSNKKDGIKKKADLLASSSRAGTNQNELTEENITGPKVMPKQKSPEISTERVEECPQPAAKRGIQFVTTQDEQHEDAETQGKLHTPKMVKLEPPSRDQPAAKPRNKRTK